MLPPAGIAARAARDLTLRGYHRAELRRPLDENLALYAAYWYRGYACNPAAIYEAARRLAPQIRGVWIVRRDRVHTLPEGVEYVVAGTAAYHRMLARARWLINNVNFPDGVAKRPGSVHVQTHHGTPVKVMGLDQQRYPLGAVGMDFAGLLRRVDRWDYSVTSNSFSTQMWERAYPAGYTTLEVGYPRNDRLVTATTEEVLRLRAALGAGLGEQVVLYAPTHREHLPRYRPPFDPERLLDALGPSGLLLVRSHYFEDADRRVRHPANRDRIVDVTDHPRVEDLYLAADVLVTDYSSAMFDYAVLDRPIVVYAPDWDAYRLTRGVYFDITAEAPGPVARTFAGLLDVFGRRGRVLVRGRPGTGAVPGAVLRAGGRARRRAGGPPGLPRRAERLSRHYVNRGSVIGLSRPEHDTFTRCAAAMILVTVIPGSVDDVGEETVTTVALKDVTKVFRDGTVAVDSINLDVNDGEFMVLLGPSGCGKSTVLRMVAGLEEPTTGAVMLNGELANDLPPRDRKIAMVFQDFALYPHMSVGDNIAFPLQAGRRRTGPAWRAGHRRGQRARHR